MVEQVWRKGTDTLGKPIGPVMSAVQMHIVSFCNETLIWAWQSTRCVHGVMRMLKSTPQDQLPNFESYARHLKKCIKSCDSRALMKISFPTRCKLWVPVCLVDMRSPRASMKEVTHQAWQASILEPCKGPSSAFLPEDGPLLGQPPAEVLQRQFC